MASNDLHSQKSKDFWNYLEENYKEVTSWPSWMKGESAKPERRLDEGAVPLDMAKAYEGK